MFEHVGETHSTRVLFCAGNARCIVVMLFCPCSACKNFLLRP